MAFTRKWRPPLDRVSKERHLSSTNWSISTRAVQRGCLNALTCRPFSNFADEVEPNVLCLVPRGKASVVELQHFLHEVRLSFRIAVQNGQYSCRAVIQNSNLAWVLRLLVHQERAGR